MARLREIDPTLRVPISGRCSRFADRKTREVRRGPEKGGAAGSDCQFASISLVCASLDRTRSRGHGLRTSSTTTRVRCRCFNLTGIRSHKERSTDPKLKSPPPMADLAALRIWLRTVFGFAEFRAGRPRS